MRRRGPSKAKFTLEEGLEREGFRPIAGAHRYQYWARAGEDRKEGFFIRLGQRTVRVVKRYRGARGIEDRPITQEFYYGKIRKDSAAILAKSFDKLK